MKLKGHCRGLVAFILLVIMISLLTACTEDEFDLEESSVSENLLSPEDKDNPVDHTQSSENTVPEIQKPLEYVETEDMAQDDDEFFLHRTQERSSCYRRECEGTSYFS